MVGLIWMVQRVVYPLMARHSPDTWVTWHTAYTRRMGSVVGPLILIELAGAVWWCVQAPASLWAWAAAVPVGVNLISTAFVQVPIHKSLEDGMDRGLIHRLVVTNWIRTAMWSLRGMLLLLLMLAAG